MKNKVVIFCLGIFFLLGILEIFYAKNILLERAEKENSLTKAICDNTKYCEDYEIICRGKDIVKITPTGAAIQFSEEWKDPRPRKEIELLCD
jgi:hypothetical protein